MVSVNVLVCMCLLVGHTAASQVTPVQQVLNMLGKMKAQGEAAMAEEKKVFAEYTEWVDDTTAQIGFSIKTEKSEIESLIAYIDQAESDIANLAKEIDFLENEIATMEADKKASTAEREEDKAEFLKVQEDYSESVSALERAIQTLKAQDYDRPQAEMLLQRMAKTEPGMRRVFAAFLEEQQQEPGAPEVAAYEFQSGGIISVLEGLLKKFSKELSDVEIEEANTAHAYALEQQHLKFLLEKDNADLEEKTALKAKRTGESEAAKGELASTKADLAADEKLLKETEATFASKSADFEANQKVRADELEAISKAIEIISSPELAGSYAEHINLYLDQQATHNLSFLQVGSKAAAARSLAKHQAAAYLQQRAATLKSQVLAEFAAKVADSPFAKVIEMIETLLERLKEEAQAEADHKAWCDEELKKNKLKRDAKTAKVNELMATIEEMEANIATMADEIKTLLAEIEALTKAMKDATEVRLKEKAENEKTIADAKAGKEATKAALVILKEFYESQAALLQQKQVPELAPYKGMQNAKTGVIGMLEVIETDFARLDADTTASEKQAAEEYANFMAESKATKEQKHKAQFKLSLEKDEAEFELGRTKSDLEAEEEQLAAANKYYEYLKPNCLEVQVSYEERVKLRQEEIEALKEAYKILDAKSA